MTVAGRRAAQGGAPAGSGASYARFAFPWLGRSRRERAVDVLIVLVTVGLGLADSRYGDTAVRYAWAWVFDVALPLPLLARRRYPMAVFLSVGALASLELLLDSPVGGNIAVLLALYAVGAHASPRRAAAAAGIAQVGVLLAVLRWAPPGQVLTGLLLLTGTVTAAWVLGVYVRTRRAYLASVLDRARTAERDRDQQALLAAANERTRIARELHDIVAHSISVMVALSDGVAATAIRDPRGAQDASQQASATGRQALTEMRRLLGVLRDGDDPELAPQPGVAQLDELLTQVRAAGLTVELVELGSPPELPPSAQLAVYRLVQESLTNVLKHGEAVTRVTVTLRYGPGSLHVLVDDNGTSGDVSERNTPDGGHGLDGMRERLAAFKGTLQAGRRERGGWRVAGNLHLDASPQQPQRLAAPEPPQASGPGRTA